MKHTLRFCLFYAVTTGGVFVAGFVQPSKCHQFLATRSRTPKYTFAVSTSTTNAEEEERTFDALLANNSKLDEAVNYFKAHPNIGLPRKRFNLIFDAIEEATSAAEAQSVNLRMEQEVPMLSQSRMDMTEMYSILKQQGHLRLFGSINKDNMPASGSHTVRPSTMEEITLLSMKSLTPKPSNTLLYAGVGVALVESVASAYMDLDLNVLFFITLAAALGDRILLNGAISESIAKILDRGTQPKITRHEAGHFLCSYILGCPLEGYVLSAWAALQDPRFGSRGVSAGTSFFDPELSKQMESSKITRSVVDRYSIIVMAGIAAEAVNFGRADGGSGDEMALIAFLSSLNGSPSQAEPVWNDLTIRNQARWGALQAVLILREYKECYEALVDAFERGATLGECIYAIENAARQHNKGPLQRPLGYIVEQLDGLDEVWTTEIPNESLHSQINRVHELAKEKSHVSPDQSLEELRAYKETITSKLRDLDEKLEEYKSN
jgi:hypothetical protein